MSEQADEVGQVIFSRDGVAGDAVQFGEQMLNLEAVDSGVDFANAALVGRCGFLLDDGGHAAVRRAQDAPIAGGVLHLDRHHAGRCAGAQVRGDEPSQGLGGDERRVPAKDQKVRTGCLQLPAGALQGVARAQLLLLPDKVQLPLGQTLQSAGHRFGLMADDNNNIPLGDFSCRAHGVFDQRPARHRVQHLGELGLQPRPQARAQNGDGNLIFHLVILLP